MKEEVKPQVEANNHKIKKKKEFLKIPFFFKSDEAPCLWMVKKI